MTATIDHPYPTLAEIEAACKHERRIEQLRTLRQIGRVQLAIDALEVTPHPVSKTHMTSAKRYWREKRKEQK